MKRLLMLTLAIALGLAGSWTAVADPAEAPVPEPTAAPAVETEVADAESLSPAEQDSEESATELEDANYGLPSPDGEMRQNKGCFYTCSHPIMCPNIINQPRPDCVNGCCVY